VAANSSEYIIVPAIAVVGGLGLGFWHSLIKDSNNALLYFTGTIVALAFGYGAVESYSKRSERSALENEKKQLRSQLNN
jgi:hypothetical protein